jgi:hypothetical protein
MPYFVFAEFGNEEVLDFLGKLRRSFTGTSISSPIHVTLRGPYDTPPSIAELQEMADLLPGYGVKISSHGYFATPKGFSVFVRAECSKFRELWDKPSFKVPLATIQPHITLYESPDRSAAAQVRDFLRTENLLIHTYSLYLSVYESRAKQSDFFGFPAAVPSGRPINRDLWRVPVGLLERADELGRLLASAHED